MSARRLPVKGFVIILAGQEPTNLVKQSLPRHEVRFYTIQHHPELDPGAVTVVNDARESAERRERALAQPS